MDEKMKEEITLRRIELLSVIGAFIAGHREAKKHFKKEMIEKFDKPFYDNILNDEEGKRIFTRQYIAANIDRLLAFAKKKSDEQFNKVEDE